MRAALLFSTLVVAACTTSTLDANDRSCAELCDELVVVCAYEAFPTRESCEQGCRYNADQGANVPGQLVCVELAECDPFLIVECEHDFGID
ncbi:MAG: hypothetical protein KTR31_36460 [Myxococcales bacterium]|nr:hypothetical protein [Myxococcales bacterium]